MQEKFSNEHELILQDYARVNRELSLQVQQQSDTQRDFDNLEIAFEQLNGKNKRLQATIDDLKRRYKDQQEGFEVRVAEKNREIVQLQGRVGHKNTVEKLLDQDTDRIVKLLTQIADL